MSSAVSVVFVFECRDQSASLPLLDALATQLTERSFEATFLCDHAIARRCLEDAKITESFKRQNIGFAAGADGHFPLEYLAPLSMADGEAEFLKREWPGYLSASKLGGAIPVAVSLGPWTPHPSVPLGEWGTRSIIGEDCWLRTDGKPYFLGGRLHLAPTGPSWCSLTHDDFTDESKRMALAGEVQRRAETLSQGGVIVLWVAPEQMAAMDPSSAESIVGLIEGLSRTPTVSIQSVRQVTDRFADISYDHAIPLDVWRAVAEGFTGPTLQAFEYEQGYLSPAEQLAGLVLCWHGSLERGKLVRNTTIKTPRGPRGSGETDAGVTQILAEELPGLLAGLAKEFESEVPVLPATVACAGGQVALPDLFATLASGFRAELQTSNLPIQRARLDENLVQPELVERSLARVGRPKSDAPALVAMSQQQLWSYKPVRGL